MRKLAVAMVLLLAMVSGASAQGLGIFPVAQGAAPVETGTFGVVGGATFPIGDGVQVFGARCNYGVIENLTVSVDVGMGKYKAEEEDVEFETDNGLLYAASAQYVFALDTPVTISARASVNGGLLEGEGGDREFEIGLMGIGAMALLGSEIPQFPGFSVYNGIGCWMALGEAEVSVFGQSASGDVDSELVISVGVVYQTPVENLSAWFELTQFNELHVSGGAGFTF